MSISVTARVSYFEQLKTDEVAPKPKRQMAEVTSKVHVIEGFISRCKREHITLANAGLPEPFDLTSYVPRRSPCEAGRDAKPAPNQPSCLTA
jgi:hypothetical protein